VYSKMAFKKSHTRPSLSKNNKQPNPGALNPNENTHIGIGEMVL
jgi:hypothetical protein